MHTIDIDQMERLDLLTLQSKLRSKHQTFEKDLRVTLEQKLTRPPIPFCRKSLRDKALYQQQLKLKRRAPNSLDKNANNASAFQEHLRRLNQAAASANSSLLQRLSDDYAREKSVPQNTEEFPPRVLQSNSLNTISLHTPTHKDTTVVQLRKNTPVLRPKLEFTPQAQEQIDPQKVEQNTTNMSRSRMQKRLHGILKSQQQKQHEESAEYSADNALSPKYLQPRLVAQATQAVAQQQQQLQQPAPAKVRINNTTVSQQMHSPVKTIIHSQRNKSSSGKSRSFLVQNHSLEAGARCTSSFQQFYSDEAGVQGFSKDRLVTEGYGSLTQRRHEVQKAVRSAFQVKCFKLPILSQHSTAPSAQSVSTILPASLEEKSVGYRLGDVPQLEQRSSSKRHEALIAQSSSEGKRLMFHKIYKRAPLRPISFKCDLLPTTVPAASASSSSNKGAQKRCHRGLTTLGDTSKTIELGSMLHQQHSSENFFDLKKYFDDKYVQLVAQNDERIAIPEEEPSKDQSPLHIMLPAPEESARYEAPLLPKTQLKRNFRYSHKLFLERSSKREELNFLMVLDRGFEQVVREDIASWRNSEVHSQMADDAQANSCKNAPEQEKNVQ